MGLETVITEVEQGGQRRAQEIRDEAQAKAGEVLAHASAQADDYAAQRAAQADKDAVQSHDQAISHAEFEARKAVLATEAELRTDLRARILEGFASLGGPLRESHLERLAKQAREVVPKGKVWGSKKDKDFLSALDGFTFAGTTDIAGGLIVEDSQGTVRLDLSYETLLDGLWRDILRSENDLFA